MLKLIHVQARLSVTKGAAQVKQMSPDEPEDYQRAVQIINIFQQGLEQRWSRDELYAQLSDYTDIRLDYREIDGLAKVICDSFASFEPDNVGLLPKSNQQQTDYQTPTTALKDEVASATVLQSEPATPVVKEISEDSEDNESGQDGQDEQVENTQAKLSLTEFRLATWREAAKPEYYPFRNTGLTVALKPGVKSLRRAAAAHDEELLSRLLPAHKRAEILRQAAHNSNYSLTALPDQLNSQLLFADLPGRQRLVALKAELNVENLLNRYNIELLRGVLYLAPRLRISVRDKYKDLFKYIKLFGLMHELKPLPRQDKNSKEKNPLPQAKQAIEPLEERELSEGEIGGYEIVLEGASSPFLARSDRRYGIQFAKFLPALLLCEAEWQLEAELIFNPAGGTAHKSDDIQKKTSNRLIRASYKLGPQPHLRTHFKGSGEFDSLLEENFVSAFEQRFKTTTRPTVATNEAVTVEDTQAEAETSAKIRKRKAAKSKKKEKKDGERQGWTILREDRIIPVFDTVMIPDFAFEHTDGRRALLEIVGFWERSYLERKIAKLNRAGRKDIIVLVSERTRCGRENFLVAGQEPPYQLIFFKGTPRLGPIMEALERCAVPPSTSTS